MKTTTAEEILEKQNWNPNSDVPFVDMYEETTNNIILAMQEYAKLKCQELLEVVVEKVQGRVRYINGQPMGIIINKDSILNAVDL